jgi:hypothetical protein
MAFGVWSWNISADHLDGIQRNARQRRVAVHCLPGLGCSGRPRRGIDAPPDRTKLRVATGTIWWHAEVMTGDLPRPVRVFTPADLASADPTPGMNRAVALELPLLWAGQVETDPGAVSAGTITSAMSRACTSFVVCSDLSLKATTATSMLVRGISCMCRPGPSTVSPTPLASHPSR